MEFSTLRALIWHVTVETIVFPLIQNPQISGKEKKNVCNVSTKSGINKAVQV